RARATALGRALEAAEVGEAARRVAGRRRLCKRGIDELREGHEAEVRLVRPDLRQRLTQRRLERVEAAHLARRRGRAATRRLVDALARPGRRRVELHRARGVE